MSGPLILLAIIAIFFVVRKHSEKIKKLAAAVASKSQNPASSPTPSATNPAGDSGKSKRIWASIILCFVALAITSFGLYGSRLKTPTFTDIGEWGLSHWFWVLFLWGVLAAIITINAKALGKAAGVLQKVLATTIFVIFFVFPVFKGARWVTRSLSGSPAAVCPDVSSQQTRSCAVGETWSNWIKPAEGPADTGLQMCFTSGVRWERGTAGNGATLFRFKAEDGGTIAVSYRLMPAGQKCPDTL